MNPIATLLNYFDMGFKLVPLDELSKGPIIAWSEIYSNPNYWSPDKLKEYPDKFYNVATTFGKSHIKDIDGKELYLYCLDVDSEEVLNKVKIILEQEWQYKTFVTKTQKDCGYHVYWFEHKEEDNEPIGIEYCKKGYEFEIKCGKSLATLPPSRHRDNPLFHYESVGQSAKIMISDGLYERLVNDILKDCFKRKKNLKSKKRDILKDGNNKCASKSSIVSQEAEDIQAITTPNNKLDHYLTTSSTISKPIILNDKQIDMSSQYLIPYYDKGTRHNFAFGFAGLCYKEDIDEASAAKILEYICKRTNDSEIDARLDSLHRTYVNGAENGSDAITGKTRLKEVIIHVSNCDNKSAEIIIQNLLKLWLDNNSDDDDSEENEFSDINSNKDKENQSPRLGKEQLLLKDDLAAAGIQNPVDYAISVINKTVKYDDSLVRAVLYAACSTWTFDPLNLGISAPTSEGKTYTVLQVLQYFPKRDVKYIGTMSPKVIIRQDSILVDAGTLKPVQRDIDTLRKQIKKEEDNEKRKQELEEQLEKIRDNVRPLIDLRGKIYVFLEPPSPELWNILKPIMSHDNFVIEHPYVESNIFQGIHVRSIITLGFPTFIFCTAKDESRWEQWQEVVSRSLIMSPNMSPKKYRESTILNAGQIGLPTAMQEALIRSRKEMELARKCVLYLKSSISEAAATLRIEGISENHYDFIYNNPVWIPYTQILGATLPAEKGTEMRTNKRLLLLLRIISLTKANQRYQLVFDNETQTVAAPEDLTEALYIVQNSSGLPPYKVKFFNEIFFAIYKKKLEEKLNEEQHLQKEVIIEEGLGVEEKNKLVSQGYGVNPSGVTLTANEICDYYNLRNSQTPINSDNLRKTYLNELISAGYIEALDVREGNIKKVYYPIIAPLEEQKEALQTDLTKETKESKADPEFFIHSKINVPIDYIPFPEDWLNFEVLRLWKCGIDISNGHYSSSLTSANNNNVPIKKEEGIVVTPSAIIHFLDKEETEEANNNNNTSSTNSYSYSNNRKKITTTQFVQKYTSLTDRLSRHFSKPIFANYHNKIFGNLQYIGIRQNIDDQNSKSTPNSQASSVCQ
jgi:hypothetical protein